MRKKGESFTNISMTDSRRKLNPKPFFRGKGNQLYVPPIALSVGVIIVCSAGQLALRHPELVFVSPMSFCQRANIWFACTPMQESEAIAANKLLLQKVQELQASLDKHEKTARSSASAPRGPIKNKYTFLRTLLQAQNDDCINTLARRAGINSAKESALPAACNA